MTTTSINASGAAEAAEHGATVVINHRIRTGQQAGYDQWLAEIAAISKRADGLLDWQILKPIDGLTATYTIILRFATQAQLQHWISSPERARMIERVRPLLATDDAFVVRSGLDFWFAQEAEKAKMPVRWKQYLVTWSAIFPLSLLISMLVMPQLHQLGLPQNRYLSALLASGMVVALMVYVVMPRYTRLLHPWLFKR